MREDRTVVFSVSRVVLLIGVILILVSSFGVTFPLVSMFELGVGIALASWLVP